MPRLRTAVIASELSAYSSGRRRALRRERSGALRPLAHLRGVGVAAAATTSRPPSTVADSQLEVVLLGRGLEALAQELELLLLGLLELHAEHPVDAALEVEAEPQALVGQQRARDAQLLRERSSPP